MDRIFGENIKGAVAFRDPCRARLPVDIVATVRGSVLKIAVLNKLGIQTAVGTIIDILEEYAYQFVRYRFCLGRAGNDGDGG